MDSNKILKKLTKFPLLDTIERFILLVMYDRYISPNQDKSMTTSDFMELSICKKSALYNNLKKLQEHGLIDMFDKRYFITPKFLYEIGKIDWEELSVKQINSIKNIKDFTIEKLNDFIDEELIVITKTQKEDLFDLLKRSSNISVSLKSWFYDNFTDNEAHVYYNRFIQKNQ